jgi:hypothetical protein
MGMKFKMKMRRVGTNKATKLIPAAIRKAKKNASSEYAKEFRSRLDDALSRPPQTKYFMSKVLDHPYAKRHPKIKTYGSMKDFMVHQDTGSFKSAFKVSTKSNQHASSINIEFIGPIRPYHAYVFFGTKKMHARNPIAGVQKDMERLNRPYRIYMKHIRKELRKVT